MTSSRMSDKSNTRRKQASHNKYHTIPIWNARFPWNRVTRYTLPLCAICLFNVCFYFEYGRKRDKNYFRMACEIWHSLFHTDLGRVQCHLVWLFGGNLSIFIEFWFILTIHLHLRTHMILKFLRDSSEPQILAVFIQNWIRIESYTTTRPLFW